ncbi:MAG: histidine kinase [Thermotogae bacterium]|nr:histidine kinase [Thermotogota bacterium]MCP5465625.1 histidine kinase [Thermotogota bacterium]
MKKNIRKKIMNYFFLLISIFSLLSLISFFNAEIILKNSNYTINDYLFLSDFKINMDNYIKELENYISSGSSQKLLSYYDYYNKIQLNLNSLPSEVQKNSEGNYKKNIKNISQNILTAAENTIYLKRTGIAQETLENFRKTLEIYDYFLFYYSKLIDIKLENEYEKYTLYNEKLKITNFFVLFSILSTILLSVYFAYTASKKITTPINYLSDVAQKVSEGKINTDFKIIKSDDEIEILSETFSEMIESIKEHINTLKLQSEYEKKIKEQELKILQSQINPHFLFNTLNIAMQLSIIENADKTSDFIEKISNMLRYNLKNINDIVSLKDEIDSVKNYMDILKIRFIKIDYEIVINSEEALYTKVPRFILQPVVENSYKHGLREDSGKITIIVGEEKNYIYVRIEDTGSGISEEKVDDIMNDRNSGIGISYVVKRLKMFCGDIEINKNKIILRFPKGGENVQNITD